MKYSNQTYLSLPIMRKAAILLLLGLVVTFHHSVPVGAITPAQRQLYTEYDILFYDEDATLPTSCSATGGASTLIGGENIEKGFNFFAKTKQLTAGQAAGIVANLIVESGGKMDPEVKQFDGGPGRGIAQWEVGARWDQLIEWAEKQKRSPTDLATQLDYLWHEFETTESAAFEAVKAAKDENEAASAFMLKFERPRDQSEAAQEGRRKIARQVLAKYGSGAPVTTPGTPSTPTCGGSDVVPSKEGFVWPLKKGDYTQVTTCIGGYRNRPGYHTGIDLNAVNKPVLAAKDGKVIEVGVIGSTGIKVIVIDHGGSLYTNYQHMNSFAVTKNQPVKAGDVIGESGNTGAPRYSTGAHLHFSVTTVPSVVGSQSPNVKQVTKDPLDYLPKEGSVPGC